MRRGLAGGLPMLAAMAVAILLFGCGKSPELAVEDGFANSQLQDIWGFYQLHIAETKKPPAKLADVDKYATGFATGYDAVKAGDYVVQWGTSVGETANPGAILAYAKAAPADGGLVLLSDGTIKKMTAEECKSRIKAK
jgi:hypothetical protein